MKKVVASIKVGLALWSYENIWNHRVLKLVGSKVDFVVIHLHPPKDSEIFSLHRSLEAKALFKVVLALTIMQSEKHLSDTLKLIKKLTGRDNVYFAINEHNGGFVQ